jgi:RNA-directed DNA polymerase
MRHLIGKGLAAAFLAGPWTKAGMVARGRAALGRRPAWLDPLVRRVLASFPAPPLDEHEKLAAWLADDTGVQGALWSGPPVRGGQRAPLKIVRWLVGEPQMVPVDGAPAGFAVFPLPSHAALARHLGLASTMLAWFADERGINARTTVEPLLHYRYQWVAKRRGGYRLLEAPKRRLKQIQRWLLRHLLAPIPAAATTHGFVPGRNVRSFAAPLVGHEVVVRVDLQDFFASVGRARVVALLRRLGYPRAVARTVAALCTAATPEHVLRAHPRQGVDLAARFVVNAALRDPHLPQGAPTSPALSNLAAWPLDRRLAALAASYGAVMSRYADDIAFAGDSGFARALRFFLPQVGAIALEEGFAVNHRKTRVLPRSRRQQLCGVVLNERTGVPRRELDLMRALLFNAARFGPESQNRDAHPRFREHLQGKIAWVASVSPAQGEKLWRLFDRIAW